MMRFKAKVEVEVEVEVRLRLRFRKAISSPYLIHELQVRYPLLKA